MSHYREAPPMTPEQIEAQMRYMADPGYKDREECVSLRTRLAAAEAELTRLRGEREGLCAERTTALTRAERAEGERDEVVAQANRVPGLTAELDGLRFHYDASAPEHNLPALLDLYLDRNRQAEAERDTARAEAARCREALERIARVSEAEFMRSDHRVETVRGIARAALDDAGKGADHG
jgi:chromosome segregation ATPase